MSRLVKRCAGRHCNNRVLGNSSFPFASPGVRGDTCRFCIQAEYEETVRAPLRRRRVLSAKLGSLSKQRSELKKKLARVERERLALRLELERAS